MGKAGESPAPIPCPNCGYDVRQTIADGFGRCPECGAWHSRKEAVKPPFRQERTLREAVPRLWSSKDNSVSIRAAIAPYGAPFALKPRGKQTWEVVERHWQHAMWPLGYAIAPVGTVVLSVVFFWPGALGASVRETLEVESFLLLAALVLVLRAVIVAARARVLTLNEATGDVELRDFGLRRTRLSTCPLGKARLSIHEVSLRKGRGNFDHAFAVVLLLETDAMVLAMQETKDRAGEFARSLPKSLQAHIRWRGPSISAPSHPWW